MAKKKKETLINQKDEAKIIDETIKELLNFLEIEGDFDFSQNEEGVEIILNTKDSGIVIGYHGEILESLQLILSLCIAKKIGRFLRVSIEVGDYKKNRIEWLKNLALGAKERVVLEKKEISLPNLKAWERRVIHLFLENDQDVMSESVGEGRDRSLVIKPRE